LKTVFFDIDTQLDFLFPAGALYVAGAEQIAPQLVALTNFAVRNGIPILSTLDTHLENDPEFKVWKPHCVAGTHGWQKYGPTVVGQTLFQKNTIDFFEDEELRRLLEEFAAERYVVYGLVTEYCVRAAILGLLRRKVQVELVTDATKSLDPAKERDVLKQFTERGGRLVEVRDIVTA
jgi:nicotinamidase/pyrazinamidase